MKKVAFHNLGCKVNAYEMELMQQKFRENGYEIVPFSEKADIYIINTCTVTNIADRKSRQMLHRAKSLSPEAIVVAAGCYVETDREGAMSDDSIDILVSNKEKADIVQIVEAYSESESGDVSGDSLLNTLTDHTRAYIKIQDGCEYLWPMVIHDILKFLGHECEETYKMLEDLCPTQLVNDNGTPCGHRETAFIDQFC